MRKESWSVIGACFLGALIGTFVALDIATRFQYGEYLWSFGAIFGGVISYIAVDFRHFCAGVAYSYRRTIAWRPEWLWWKTFAIMASAFSMACLYFFGFASIGVAIDYSSTNLVVKLMLASFGLGSITGLLFMAMAHPYAKTEMGAEHLRKSSEFGWKVILYGNPVGATLAICRGLILVVPRAPSVVAQAGRIISKFVVEVFIYVHSERRTLCFVDATIGASIGYAFGSSIIGALAGVVLGILNYEVVSVRWLKLVPVQKQTT